MGGGDLCDCAVLVMHQTVPLQVDVALPVLAAPILRGRIGIKVGYLRHLAHENGYIEHVSEL